MPTLLELRELRARYGHVEVLHDVSLHVAEGEKVTLLGPNGAGKTTLLRAVSRAVATSGAITFAGQDLTRQDPAAVAALGIGHVPAGRGTFPDLTVLENLRLGLSGRRDSKADRRHDLDLMLATFGVLGDFAGRRAGQLSGGQQQMLALGRALLARPRLLLVDEPSLGLAPLVVRSLFDTLRGLQEAWGLAVLLAEQNARLSLDLADRAYVLVAGRVALAGPASSISLADLHEAYLGHGSAQRPTHGPTHQAGARQPEVAR